MHSSCPSHGSGAPGLSFCGVFNIDHTAAQRCDTSQPSVALSTQPLGQRWKDGTRVDVARFLAELHSTLDRLELQIGVLEQLDATTGTKLVIGPGLSASELEPFRGKNATARWGSDRMRWLQ
jgi:hypothetical protein